MNSSSQIYMRWHISKIICQRFSSFLIIPICYFIIFIIEKSIPEKSFHCILIIDIHLFSELYKSVRKENMVFGCLYTIYFHNMLQFHVRYLFFWTPTHTTSPVLSQSVTDRACAFVRSKCVNTRCLSSTQMWTVNAFVSICI